MATVIILVASQRAQAGGANENLLPASTKGFVSVTNFSELSAQWKKTQVGQLMADPAMKPFAEDLRRQLQTRWSGLREKLGMTFDDLQGVPDAEVSVGMIEIAPKQSAMVLLMDVTNHQPEAQKLLQTVSARLTSQGAKQTNATMVQTPVLVFDLPNDERNTYYFLKNNLLGAANDPSAVQAVLLRQGGQTGESLADVPVFQAAMARCQKDAGNQAPQIRWFIEPIAYAELTRSDVPEEQRRRTRRHESFLDVAKKQGFIGLRGIGGFVSVNAENTQVTHRTAIVAPPPFAKSLKMLRFVNNRDFTPPAWVPREIATYTTFYADVLNAFDNFGPLFDELFGQGEKGVWVDTLKGLKDDPDGPQIDLREELFVNLDNRIIVLTDYQLPITTTSERLLFAIQTKDEKRVAAAIKKAMDKDETVRRRVFEGHVIWESVPEEKKPAESPRIELGRVPKLGPDEEEEEEQAPKLLPNQAVTVANGYLMVASNYDFLVKVLHPVDLRETLAKDVDYRVVEATSAQKGAGQDFLWGFSRTDEEYRPTYELLRQGKMPESQSILGRILNTAADSGKKGELRKQQVDGSKMPDYDFVRRSLGPSGTFGAAEPNGWFFKGYVLPKP
jgi:hypothetical protein